MGWLTWRRPVLLPGDTDTETPHAARNLKTCRRNCRLTRSVVTRGRGSASYPLRWGRVASPGVFSLIQISCQRTEASSEIKIDSFLQTRAEGNPNECCRLPERRHDLYCEILAVDGTVCDRVALDGRRIWSWRAVVWSGYKPVICWAILSRWFRCPNIIDLFEIMSLKNLVAYWRKYFSEISNIFHFYSILVIFKWFISVEIVNL